MAVPKRKGVEIQARHAPVAPSIAAVNLGECSNCGELKLAHHICQACGHYNGREVIAQVADSAGA